MNDVLLVCDPEKRVCDLLQVILVLLTVALPLQSAAEANGQEMPATAEDAAGLEPPPEGFSLSFAEAQEAKSKASQLFHENRFVEAAQLLRMAYSGDPRPILLFNAGQAYRRAEMPQEARAMYEQFLALAPDHVLAGETRGYIKDMEALEATQAHAKLVTFALEERLEQVKTREQQAAMKLEKERQAALQAKQALTLTQEQLLRERNKPFYRKPWFFSVITGVSAVVIAGTVAGSFLIARARTDAGNVVITQ